MSNQDNFDIEAQAEQAAIDHDIKMGEALARLKDNKDFQTVIMDGYLKDKALASVSLMAVPSQRQRRSEIIEDINSASNLQYFFAMIEQFYAAALDPALTDEELAAMETPEGAQ